MLTINYHKDYRHNYLILKCREMPDKYQCRMITENMITGLLPCQERHIDGETLLYYEISSRQSLASLYEADKITMEKMGKILLQLKMVTDALSRFLLEEKGLVLSPELLFSDVETGRLFFLYNPEAETEETLSELLEFFVDKVDIEDRDAAETAYRLLELVSREQFVLDEVLQWFEGEQTEKSPFNFDEGMKEEQRRQEQAKDWEECEIKEKEGEEGGENGSEKTEGKKGAALPSLFYKICMAAGIVCAGILYYIYTGYELGKQELVYIYAGFLTSFLSIAGGAFYLLRDRHLEEKHWIAAMTKGFQKEGREKEQENSATFCGEAFEGKWQSTGPFSEMPPAEKQPIGNTVFIPWSENRENKLYGIDKGNKHHIDLCRLPLTVGKLAGSVDMVIADQSVSRRHARFSKEGNGIYISDLNSTNGTFKNGLRLEPNSSALIEPGDEIRLGKLKFIYR